MQERLRKLIYFCLSGFSKWVQYSLTEKRENKHWVRHPDFPLLSLQQKKIQTKRGKVRNSCRQVRLSRTETPFCTWHVYIISHFETPADASPWLTVLLSFKYSFCANNCFRKVSRWPRFFECFVVFFFKAIVAPFVYTHIQALPKDVRG